MGGSNSHALCRSAQRRNFGEDLPTVSFHDVINLFISKPIPSVRGWSALGRRLAWSNYAHSMDADPVPRSIALRRNSGMASKKRAERSQALKSHGETDARHRHVRLDQQPLRALDTASREVLVRRLLKHLLETSQEMERRETRDRSNICNAQRPFQIRFHVVASEQDSSIHFQPCTCPSERQQVNLAAHFPVYVQQTRRKEPELLFKPGVRLAVILDGSFKPAQ